MVVGWGDWWWLGRLIGGGWVIGGGWWADWRWVGGVIGGGCVGRLEEVV